MREIVLDTETTGFEPKEGHRIVEIGALELNNHVPTGEKFHVYINPERDMPEEAFRVHGLSDEFLSDKPKFSEVAQAFLDFVGESPMVIHNAEFDMKFINAELQNIGRSPIPDEQAIDTVRMARRKFPGAPASLDALCRRFSVDNSNRTLHGALLDSELLAEVYLQLIGGHQPHLELEESRDEVMAGEPSIGARPQALPPRITDDERQAHEAYLKTLNDALWLKMKNEN